MGEDTPARNLCLVAHFLVHLLTNIVLALFGGTEIVTRRLFTDFMAGTVQLG